MDKSILLNRASATHRVVFYKRITQRLSQFLRFRRFITSHKLDPKSLLHAETENGECHMPTKGGKITEYAQGISFVWLILFFGKHV